MTGGGRCLVATVAASSTLDVEVEERESVSSGVPSRCWHRGKQEHILELLQSRPLQGYGIFYPPRLFVVIHHHVIGWLSGRIMYPRYADLALYLRYRRDGGLNLLALLCSLDAASLLVYP